MGDIAASNRVIVVLGYKNAPDGQLHPIAKQRADKAFDMARQTSDPFICTGGFGDNFNQSPYPHSAWVQKYLQNKGIDTRRFLPVAESRNTYEDGKLCAEILNTRGLTTNGAKITLVTSDFHMKRGFLWFQLFCPDYEITCAPSKTIASIEARQKLIAHEKRAIEYFYRDFPETEELDELYDWRSLDL